METERIVHLHEVTKCFGNRTILDKVTLSIFKGESIALTGDNGNGKSTLLRLIAGLIRPTSGTIVFSGDKLPAIGFVPDRFPKLPFTANEYLMHMGLIHGLNRQQVTSRIRELLQIVNLYHAADVKIANYSKGMLQKIGFVQAVLAKPELLLLDEPLSGLDETSTRDVAALLSRLKQERLTLLFACHGEGQLYELADSVLNVREGRIDAIAFKHKVPLTRIQAAHMAAGQEDIWRSFNGVTEVRTTAAGLQITVIADQSDVLLRELLNQGASILSVQRMGERSTWE
ncbi:ABC transporter ATP-binding protein [Paenibacillaceae bacterium]|nr:ABC transporter ATP-binding protein [Paenibacillaceae bacterium]